MISAVELTYQIISVQETWGVIQDNRPLGDCSQEEQVILYYLKRAESLMQALLVALDKKDE